MKYLRKIYENKIDDLNEISDQYLSFLIDSGYLAEISQISMTKYSILFHKRNEYNFKWDDIKEDIIAYIELLSIKYSIDGKIHISLSDPNWKNNGKAVSPVSSLYTTIDEISNINVDNYKIRFIEIEIIY